MKRIKAVLVVIATLAFALSPLLSSGFNGFSAGQFPVPQQDPPAQPAGYAFSIWGVIYLWLLVGAGFGLIKRSEALDWDAMRWPLIASLTVGSTWIPVANASPFWATVLIWVMLLTAIVALVSAGPSDRFWLRSPIALYAGWLTAASAVSLALMLAGYGITGGTTAAILCIALSLVIAATVQFIRSDSPEYALAVVWALIGVIVSNTEPLNWPVIGLAGVGIVTLGLIVVKRRTVR